MAIVSDVLFKALGVLLVAFVVFAFLGYIFGIYPSIINCPKDGEPIPLMMIWCNNKTTYYDDVAVGSVQALSCAVNSVADGEFSKKACPAETVMAGFLPLAAAQPSERCFGELEKVCVSCEVIGPPKIGTEKMFENNVLSSVGAKKKCEATCPRKGSEEFGRVNGKKCVAEMTAEKFLYDYVYEAHKRLQAQCIIDEDLKPTVEGLSRKQILENCASDFKTQTDKLTLKYTEVVESKTIYTDTHAVQGKGYKCTCTLEGSGEEKEEYPVYGLTENIAKLVCIQDLSSSSKSKNPFKSYKVDCQPFEGEMIFAQYHEKVIPGGTEPLFSEGTEYYASKFECSRKTFTDNLKCTVTNFKLPQDINAKDLGVFDVYIPFFGLPERLVYWQDFPLDEDTWSSSSDFLNYVLVGSVFLIGPLKIVKIAGKAAKASKFAKLSVLTSGVAVAIKSNFVTLSKWKWLMNSVRLVASGTYLGGYEIWKSMKANVMEEYLKPHPNELVFLKALDGKQKFEGGSLSESLKWKPVLLQWNPSWTDYERNLYFVSPCYLKEFKVSPAIFGCSTYIRDDKLGTVTCLTDAQGTYDVAPELPSCESMKAPTDVPRIKVKASGPNLKLLEDVFQDLGSKRMPDFPNDKTFYKDGFYFVPFYKDSCNIGKECQEEVLFAFDSTISYNERRSRSEKTGDYFLVQRTYKNERGERIDENKKISLSKASKLHIDYYYKSDEEDFTFYYSKAKASFPENVNIYKDENGDNMRTISFRWGVDEDSDIRKLTITYGELVVILSDDGGTEGKTSSINIQTVVSGYTASYLDKDEDGVVDVLGFTNTESMFTSQLCITDGVVVNDLRVDSGKSPNYCIRERSTVAKITEVASWVGFGASFFFGGWTSAILMVGSGVTEVAASHKQTWPDGGIG
ncbi:MAG: hypothetical protein ISS93_02200 [Candidatus Aenigmarchaeota archaeon]|nr:hypothetical protein [Candidatus Aenigmarchaeota archaeon]